MARPSARHVALLRGINVGGHRVSMNELRALFEAQGFTNVETFIASGNVIFDVSPTIAASTLETRIEKSLGEALGYAVPTFLRTPAELAAAASHTPFSAKDANSPNHRIHVGFLRTPPTAAFARELATLATSYDAFAVNGREMYWLTRGGFSDTLVPWVKFEKRLKLELTMRNMATVSKLVAKYAARP